MTITNSNQTLNFFNNFCCPLTNNELIFQAKTKNKSTKNEKMEKCVAIDENTFRIKWLMEKTITKNNFE